MDRRSFILALGRAGVDAIQVSAQELKAEVESELESRRVVNASPIIFLDRVGLLDQLNEAGVTVLVPDFVLEELGGLTPDDPAAVAVRSASWIQVVAAPPIPDSLRHFRLDRGEEPCWRLPWCRVRKRPRSFSMTSPPADAPR